MYIIVRHDTWQKQTLENIQTHKEIYTNSGFWKMYKKQYWKLLTIVYGRPNYLEWNTSKKYKIKYSNIKANH